MTNPKLLLAGLDQHKSTLEYLHINSINGQNKWEPHEDARFHGDTESIDSDYDWENEEHATEHERRQRIACEELKEAHIQPLDLHDLTALKKLFVHHTDLLGAMNKEDPTDVIALADVLPPSLELLTLRYSNYFSDWDPQLTFIYEQDIGGEPDDTAPWDVVQWQTKEQGEWYHLYYEHITNLMRVKAKKFPNLVQVTMCLDHGWPKPGQELRDLVAEVGVKLIVGVYVSENEYLD
jgi:hypothetical protein